MLHATENCPASSCTAMSFCANFVWEANIVIPSPPNLLVCSGRPGSPSSPRIISFDCEVGVSLTRTSLAVAPPMFFKARPTGMNKRPKRRNFAKSIQYSASRVNPRWFGVGQRLASSAPGTGDVFLVCPQRDVPTSFVKLLPPTVVGRLIWANCNSKQGSASFDADCCPQRTSSSGVASRVELPSR